MVSPIKCRNRRWNANRLEESVWQKIEALLNRPGIVLRLKEKANDAIEVSPRLEQELVQVSKRLKALDREQEQLLQWALKGFPEETVVAENKRINEQRDVLKQRRIELETRIEQARQIDVNFESIEQFCEQWRQNLGEFTFEDKRLALEALQLKVWVDGDDEPIMEGAIPIPEVDFQSITSRCSG